MKVNNKIDEEPSEENSSTENTQAKKKSAYQKLKRDLNEEDLNSPGALKLVINDLDRLEEENARLQKLRDSYHESEKRKAVLEEKLNVNTGLEILYTAALGIGATLMGLTPSILNKTNYIGELILGCGIALFFGGIIAKVAAGGIISKSKE